MPEPNSVFFAAHDRFDPGCLGRSRFRERLWEVLRETYTVLHHLLAESLGLRVEILCSRSEVLKLQAQILWARKRWRLLHHRRRRRIGVIEYTRSRVLRDPLPE